MGMLQETERASFDFDSWKESGESALAECRARKEKLAEELAEVTGEIKRLEKALSVVKSGSNGPKVKRLHLKPAIENMLQSTGDWFGVNDLLSGLKVMPGFEEATARGVENCCRRLGKSDGYQVRGRGSDFQIYFTGNSENTNMTPDPAGDIPS